MKLIILYGAPAVGKYTIAKQLKSETKYKLLHIHSIYDFLEDVFGKDNYETSLLILQNTVLDIFEKAAKKQLPGLIFTYAHLAENNFSFAKKIKKILKKYKVEIFFIHLVCKKDILRKRITNTSRKKFKKTKTVKELNYLLSKKDYHTSYSTSNNLKLNTANTTGVVLAKKIAKYIFND